MNTKILNKINQMIKDSPQLLLDNDLLHHSINGEFSVDIQHTFTTITSLVTDIDEAVMKKYFSDVWQPETKKYKYSGLSIIDEVNALNPTHVLDVGCGYNEFKGKIQNLTGIDPYNNRADIMVHTLEYKTNILYDVVICLGSINFGSTDKIIKELQKVVGLTKQGGLVIFRANPGIQHKAFESQWIDFFDWNTSFIVNIAQTLKCKVVQLHRDVPQNAVNGGRFYFVLEKN
jgi:hypothetical protein